MAKNALTTFGAVEIPFSPAAVATPKRKSSGKFLPHLKFLANESCSEVKKNQAEAGHWCLIEGDTVTDLGEEIVAIPFVRLDKAMDNSGDEPVVAYGIENEAYVAIAEEVDVDGYDSGCMYGPIFLLYLVDTEQWVDMWLYSVSARNEADNINLFLPVSKEYATEECPARPPRPATLGGKEITITPKKGTGKKKFTYNCPTTAEGPKTLQLENPPTGEDAVAECVKFIAQSKPAAEGDEDSDGSRER
jgi:hypothetical protein